MTRHESPSPFELAAAELRPLGMPAQPPGIFMPESSLAN